MGVILMILASASFATMSALIKAVGPGVSSMELVFLRCALSVPLLFFFMRVQKKPLIVSAKKTIIYRTIFGLGAMIGFFYALVHMPLAECIFIGRSQPLILCLVAPLVLGEKTPRSAWFALACGLVGVALIMKPAMEWPVASWVALGAATASALAHLLVRRLNATDDPLVIVFDFTFLAALVTSIYVVPDYEPLARSQWIYVAGIVIFSCIGQILMTTAYKKDRASVVASASYTSVILSIIYGYFFWGEIPPPVAWLGGVLIIFGGLMLLRARINVSEPVTPAAT